MRTGTVLWFNDISGAGRIRDDDGSFLNVSQKSLQHDGYKTLDEGQRVYYEAIISKSGLEARCVGKW